MFLTEFFVRPRPKHDGCGRRAGDLFATRHGGGPAAAATKPADFPRIARRAK